MAVPGGAKSDEHELRLHGAGVPLGVIFFDPSEFHWTQVQGSLAGVICIEVPRHLESHLRAKIGFHNMEHAKRSIQKSISSEVQSISGAVKIRPISSYTWSGVEPALDSLAGLDWDPSTAGVLGSATE